MKRSGARTTITAMNTTLQPLAIAMWDFSWLERRWPGAGYEDWDAVLDQLVERGYNAVRIDAYPHLVATDPRRTWTLLPVWDQQMWGSPAVTCVAVQPALNEFLAKCRDRRIRVGLSTWFREDAAGTRMEIASAEQHAEIWLKTLATIAADGLLDTVLYVDLCNEWPGDTWAPFFRNDPPSATWGCWHTDRSLAWMGTALAAVRRTHPDLPLCFSFDGMEDRFYRERDLSGFDLIEHHIWMAKENEGEFVKLAGYDFARFSPQGYINLAARGEKLFRERPDYWRRLLTDRIVRLAAAATAARQPLVTTECWAVVDYKDWPLLSWDWVKDLCELGVTAAAATGRWLGMATNNFCGPQFVGLWRDVGWHQRLTQIIRHAIVDPLLAQQNGRLVRAMRRAALASPLSPP